MTSASAIKIHQALHGYTDGHRELALSATLSARDTKTLLTLSDRSGPGVKIPSGGYLTGYPLAESSLYVVARTWAAPELPRPGCVWTHSLLVDFTDLATIEDATGLLRMFIRPGSGIPSVYHEPIQYLPATPNTPELFESEARHILAALYGRPTDRIIAGVSQADPNILALSVWSQQWPRLRRAFRFCSLSASDRSTNSAPFDLQLLPPDKVARSRFQKGIEAERVSIPDATWLDDALDDLLRPGANGLRSFLWRVGGDVARGRESFASLCRLHPMLDRIEQDAASFDEAFALLDREFETGQARFARIAITRAAVSQPERLHAGGLDFVLRNLEFLGSDPALETLQNIGVELWRRDPARVALMLTETGTAHLIATNAIDSVPVDSLIAGISVAPSILAEVLHRRPQVLGDPSIWSLDGLDTHAALKLAASDPSLAAAAATALVAMSHDLAYPTVNAFGASCVGRAVLQVDSPLNVSRSWYEAVAAHPQAVAELFASHAASNRQSLVQFARVMQPDTLPNDVGADPWITALTTSRGEVPELDKSYFRAFIMARAFGNRSKQAAELAIQTFELIHSALAHRQMPDDGWQLIEKRLPWSWADWDRCSRIRDAVGKLFSERGFPPAVFNRLTANDQLFSALADNMASSSRGRDYLKNVRKAMKDSGDQQYNSRIKILNKVL